MSLFTITKSYALTLAIRARDNAWLAYKERRDENNAAKEKYVKERLGQRGFMWRKLDREHWEREFSVRDHGYISVHVYEKRHSALCALVARIELVDGSNAVQLDTKDMGLIKDHY